MQYKSRYLKGPSLVINLYHIEQHQVSCCVTSSNIKMEPTSKRTTIVIAELIKRIREVEVKSEKCFWLMSEKALK